MFSGERTDYQYQIQKTKTTTTKNKKKLKLKKKRQNSLNVTDPKYFPGLEKECGATLTKGLY